MNNVRQANVDDLNAIAECHIAAFPGEFLSLLGREFLIDYYAFYLSHKEGICLVCLDESSHKVVGLVAGGAPNINEKFMKSRLPRKALTVFKQAIRHPRVRSRLIEHACRILGGILRRLGVCKRKSVEAPVDDSWGRWANLLSVCVHPSFRKRGIGALLMDAFRRECGHRGYSYIRLSVHNDNINAIKLYERQGWEALLQTRNGTYFGRYIKESK